MTVNTTTLLSAIVIDALSYEKFERDWVMSDDEVGLIAGILEDINASSLAEIRGAIKAFVRADTKTRRLLISGYVIYDGIGYFATEADAVEFLQNNNFPCTSFGEAIVASRKGAISACYETTWYLKGESENLWKTKD